MTVICRTLRIGSETSAALTTGAMSLATAIASSRQHSDVYRYWQGIEFLLQRHAAGSRAAAWRSLGRREQATATDAGEADLSGGDVPVTQHLAPEDVQLLASLLRTIEPEHLAAHYDAAALDAANVYPSCWQGWEETFDPLGQLLEHYHFLRQTADGAAAAGDALLLVYEDDGDVPYDEDLD